MKQLLHETKDDLTSVLETLDAAAAEPSDNEEQRKEMRRPIRKRCEIYVFKGLGAEAVAPAAVARNLTFGGLSVVATIDEPVCPGRPVEAIVTLPNNERTHLAGIVAFCRKVEGNCYELGIEVRAAGKCSILKQDVQASRKLYDWFASALDVSP